MIKNLKKQNKQGITLKLPVTLVKRNTVKKVIGNIIQKLEVT